MTDQIQYPRTSVGEFTSKGGDHTLKIETETRPMGPYFILTVSPDVVSLEGFNKHSSAEKERPMFYSVVMKFFIDKTLKELEAKHGITFDKDAIMNAIDARVKQLGEERAAEKRPSLFATLAEPGPEA